MREGEELEIGDGVPDKHGGVVAAEGEAPRIRRPGQRPHGSAVAIRKHLAPGGNFPHLDQAIRLARGDTRTTLAGLWRLAEQGTQHFRRPGRT